MCDNIGIPSFIRRVCVLLIIKEKSKVRERRWDGVGVMKDKKCLL